MTLFHTRINAILEEVKYRKGWRFEAKPLSYNESIVQLFADVPCCNEPDKVVTLASHKVILEEHMDKTRILRILYILISAMEEHERTEFFLWGDRKIYSHHLSASHLWQGAPWAGE